MSDRNSDIQQQLLAMRRGSVEAFEQFYDRFVTMIFNIASRVIGDPMEAEDICHDVFLEVLRKADRFDPSRGSIEAWLAVITRSRCLDRIRQKQRVQIQQWEDLTMSSDAGFAPTEETALAKIEQEMLLTAMRKIPESQRKAVYGMYFEACTQRQLSERMNHPLGTIKSYIRYGLNNLRKQLYHLKWGDSTGGANHNEPS